MRCRECGASLPQDAAECAECGARVSPSVAKTSAPAHRRALPRGVAAPPAGRPWWFTHALALGIGIAIGIAIGYGIPRATPAGPAASPGPGQTTAGEMRLPPGHPDISSMMKGGRAAPAMPMDEK